MTTIAKFVISLMMDYQIFEKLRQHFGTHKNVAKAIRLSYTRYNEWRWKPDNIPEYGKILLELTLSKIEATNADKAGFLQEANPRCRPE